MRFDTSHPPKHSCRSTAVVTDFFLFLFSQSQSESEEEPPLLSCAFFPHQLRQMRHLEEFHSLDKLCIAPFLLLLFLCWVWLVPSYADQRDTISVCGFPNGSAGFQTRTLSNPAALEGCYGVKSMEVLHQNTVRVGTYWKLRLGFSNRICVLVIHPKKIPVLFFVLFLYLLLDTAHSQ